MKYITYNRRAQHNYELLEKYEAGLVLLGWEVKAIRAGRVQIVDAHVVLSRGEFFLIHAHITPLISASSHVLADPLRSRKLLLHENECRRLLGKIKETGAAIIPIDLHLTRGKIKVTISLAKGKKKYDKRRSIEEKEWKRQQARILRSRS